MKKMQRKIDWWQNKKRHGLGPETILSRSHLECSEAGIQYSYYKDALKALENHPKWISVEERLPEESDAYITWSKYGRKVLIYHAGLKKWGSVWIGEFDIPVTHWMYMPEPPKEEE